MPKPPVCMFCRYRRSNQANATAQCVHHETPAAAAGTPPPSHPGPMAAQARRAQESPARHR